MWIGAGDVALLPLGRLADVEHDGLAALAQRVGFGRRDLGDLGAGLPQEVGVGLRHGGAVSGGRQATAGRGGAKGRAVGAGPTARAVDESAGDHAGRRHLQRPGCAAPHEAASAGAARRSSSRT